MIILDIEKYCQECGHFRPDLEMMVYCDRVDTVIRCEDRDKCRRMIEYLREGVKNEREDRQMDHGQP